MIARRDVTEIQGADSFTQTQLEEDCIFLGIVYFSNKLKSDTYPRTIQTLKNADIAVSMITGDHVQTAVAIAKECHIIDSETSLLPAVNEDSTAVISPIIGDLRSSSLALSPLSEPTSKPYVLLLIDERKRANVPMHEHSSLANSPESPHNAVAGTYIPTELNVDDFISLTDMDTNESLPSLKLQNIVEWAKRRCAAKAVCVENNMKFEDEAMKVLEETVYAPNVASTDTSLLGIHRIEIVMTGAAFRVIKTMFPQFVEHLARTTSVFCRTKPADKKNIVLELMKPMIVLPPSIRRTTIAAVDNQRDDNSSHHAAIRAEINNSRVNALVKTTSTSIRKPTVNGVLFCGDGANDMEALR
jgi:magnesium-transporting ATPase (P-type)